ncbi:hypothetical protein SAMN05444722_3736 [Rhodovulum sp. ES.010]|nr:hypothetical protein SAMN05444722_3736 [Rhodovulum sp. ES.010]
MMGFIPIPTTATTAAVLTGLLLLAALIAALAWAVRDRCAVCGRPCDRIEGVCEECDRAGH